MRITDVLRGQSASVLESIDCCRGLGELSNGGRVVARLLERMIRSHRRTTDPLLAALEEQLGTEGLLRVVRIDVERLERDASRLVGLEDAVRVDALGRLIGRFADHLMLVSLLLLPLADLCLTEPESRELGTRWCAEQGVPLLS